MQKVTILLSLDHELSLGGARNFDANVFAPTDRALAVAGELGVPLTLFTDVLCAMRFEEWDRVGFYEPYCEQVRMAIRDGHDAQLHIHPHWADSEHDGLTFLPSRKFALADFAAGEGERSIEGIVSGGVRFLEELCRKADPDYRCIAYRAGGFNMAPETKRILNALWEAGIRIDSSIPKGFAFRSSLSQIDYRDMPAAANWHIAPDGPLNADAGEGFFEIPVGTRPRTPWNNLAFLARRVLLRGRAPRSTGKPIHEPYTPLPVRLARLFPRSAWLLGFDLFTDTVESQMRVLEEHLAAHADDPHVLVSAISHPKNMGTHSFKLLRGFVEQVRFRYGSRAEFVTFQEIERRRNAAAGKARSEAEPCPVKS